jgi:transposase-like protein DUF772
VRKGSSAARDPDRDGRSVTQLARRFDGMYGTIGRPSIAPEKLLRAQLLQRRYSICSERLPMEEMNLQSVVHRFRGAERGRRRRLGRDRVTKNRDRLLKADVAKGVFGQGGGGGGPREKRGLG